MLHPPAPRKEKEIKIEGEMGGLERGALRRGEDLRLFTHTLARDQIIGGAEEAKKKGGKY